MAFTVVSTAADGTKGNDGSDSPVFSPDGTSVVFDSTATNLVAGTPSGSENFFVKNLATGAISQVFNVPEPGNSLFPVVSKDDTELTFQSTDTDLVAAANNGNDQIFVENSAGAFSLASSTMDGTQSNGGNFVPSFSADGTMVAFQSNATNLGSNPNSNLELFVKNLKTGSVQLVSTSASGGTGNASDQILPAAFSPDGTRIAFSSQASNLVAGADGSEGFQVFVKNLGSGGVTLASSTAGGTQSNAGGSAPVFSPDGTEVAFTSQATNLSAQATSGAVEIYVKNLVSGTLTLVSSAADGTASNGGIDYTTPPVFSPDGTEIAFASSATNLTPAGTVGSSTQVYVKNLTTGAITLISKAADGTPGNSSSSNPAFSPDGTRIAFQSGATNLVPSNNNSPVEQVFVTDLATCFASGTAIRVARRGSWADVAVEDLAVGDLVVTASGLHRRIRWVGCRVVDCGRHRSPREVMPIRIAAHAFGENSPTRDLHLSPGHPVLVGADDDGEGGHLVPIMCLINGTTISRALVDSVTYWHVELDEHDILLAEGLPAESYIDLGSRPWFAGAEGVLYDPDLALPDMPGRCRPVAVDGPVVEAERRRLDVVFAARHVRAAAWPTTHNALLALF